MRLFSNNSHLKKIRFLFAAILALISQKSYISNYCPDSKCIFQPAKAGLRYWLYLIFFKVKIRLFLAPKSSCCFCAAILFLLLAVYELICGEYFDQSDCRIANIRWMTIS